MHYLIETNLDILFSNIFGDGVKNKEDRLTFMYIFGVCLVQSAVDDCKPVGAQCVICGETRKN